MPLHRTIFETLCDEIKEGRYQEAFPSEAQLIRRFAVGRQTILRVIGDLVGAGLIERHRGSGSIVSRRVRQKLGDVGLIMPHLTSSPFTSAAAEACRAAGYTLLFKELGGRHPLVPTERRVKGAFSLAMELAEENVLGVLMQPVQNVVGFERINSEILAAFKKRRIPVVLVDHDVCFPPARSACDIVCMDNFHAGYSIGHHLLERGAKKIAFLMHGEWAPSVMERMHGLALAVAEARLGWNLGRNVIACHPDDANPTFHVRGKKAGISLELSPRSSLHRRFFRDA